MLQSQNLDLLSTVEIDNYKNNKNWWLDLVPSVCNHVCSWSHAGPQDDQVGRSKVMNTAIDDVCGGETWLKNLNIGTTDKPI